LFIIIETLNSEEIEKEHEKEIDEKDEESSRTEKPIENQLSKPENPLWSSVHAEIMESLNKQGNEFTLTDIGSNLDKLEESKKLERFKMLERLNMLEKSKNDKLEALKESKKVETLEKLKMLEKSENEFEAENDEDELESDDNANELEPIEQKKRVIIKKIKKVKSVPNEDSESNEDATDLKAERFSNEKIQEDDEKETVPIKKRIIKKIIKKKKTNKDETKTNTEETNTNKLELGPTNLNVNSASSSNLQNFQQNGNLELNGAEVQKKKIVKKIIKKKKTNVVEMDTEKPKLSPNNLNENSQTKIDLEKVNDHINVEVNTEENVALTEAQKKRIIKKIIKKKKTNIEDVDTDKQYSSLANSDTRSSLEEIQQNENVEENEESAEAVTEAQKKRIIKKIVKIKKAKIQNNDLTNEEEIRKADAEEIKANSEANLNVQSSQETTENESSEKLKLGGNSFTKEKFLFKPNLFPNQIEHPFIYKTASDGGNYFDMNALVYKYKQLPDGWFNKDKNGADLNFPLPPTETKPFTEAGNQPDEEEIKSIEHRPTEESGNIFYLEMGNCL
jgi:hypothetical protein